MKKVLFVCTGNTCRSPMAEAIFRAKTQGKGFEVCSAGVSACDGQPASLHAIQVLQERGIESEHVSTRLNDELLAWADVILTMTRSHKQAIRACFPQAGEKVYTLREFVGAEGFEDIIDPYGGALQDYRRCAVEIEELVDMLSHIMMEKSFR